MQTLSQLAAKLMICDVYFKVAPKTKETKIFITTTLEELTKLIQDFGKKDVDADILLNIVAEELPSTACFLEGLLASIDELLALAKGVQEYCLITLYVAAKQKLAIQSLSFVERCTEKDILSNSFRDEKKSYQPSQNIFSPPSKPYQNQHGMSGKGKKYYFSSALLGALFVVGVVALVGVLTGGVGAAFLAVAAGLKLSCGSVGMGVILSATAGMVIGMGFYGLFRSISNCPRNNNLMLHDPHVRLET